MRVRHPILKWFNNNNNNDDVQMQEDSDTAYLAKY